MGPYDAMVCGRRHGFVGSREMAKVLEKRGEGFHHMTFEVDDVDKEISRLAERGIELIDKQARPGFEGMVAFVHPKSVRGVLVELCQRT